MSRTHIEQIIAAPPGWFTAYTVYASAKNNYDLYQFPIACWPLTSSQDRNRTVSQTVIPMETVGFELRLLDVTDREFIGICSPSEPLERFLTEASKRRTDAYNAEQAKLGLGGHVEL